MQALSPTKGRPKASAAASSPPPLQQVDHHGIINQQRNNIMILQTEVALLRKKLDQEKAKPPPAASAEMNGLASNNNNNDTAASSSASPGLVNQVQQLSREKQELSEVVAAHRSVADSIKDELKLSQEQLAEMERKHNAQKNEISKNTGQLALIRADRDRLEKLLAEKESHVVTQDDSLDQIYAARAADMQKMQSLLDEKELMLQEMTRKCDQYEMLLNSKDGTLKFYETQMKTNLMKADQSLVEEQLSHMRQEYQKTMMMYDRIFVDKKDLQDQVAALNAEKSKLTELNHKYSQELITAAEQRAQHEERKRKMEALEEKYADLERSRVEMQNNNELVKAEKMELEDRLVDMSIKMRSRMDALDLNAQNWDMSERRAAEDAQMCANHFKAELEKVHHQLAAAQAEVTSLRPNLDLLLQEKSRLQRELAEARMLKDQHLEYAQELQKDLELRANFEADLISAQEILTQKDKELEEEKNLREHQLATLKSEYERVVEEVQSSQKMTDLLDALQNQGTFDALNNLSTLADAVVKNQQNRGASASIPRGASAAASTARGLSELGSMLESLKRPSAQ